MTDGIRTATIYARTSGDDAEDRAGGKTSIADQVKVCREWARANGVEIVAEHTDKTRSSRIYWRGAPLIGVDTVEQRYFDEHVRVMKRRSRPGLAQVIETLPRVDAVIVLTRDRLYRSLLHSHLEAAIWQELRTHGVKLVTAADGQTLEADSYSGQLVASIDNMAKSRDVEENRRKAQLGRKTKRDSGYLYRRPDCYGIRSAGRQSVEVIEDQAAVVRRIFDSYARQGHGIQRIVRDLTADDCETYNGGAWTQVQVRMILRRESYAGLSTNTDGELIPSLVFPAIISPDIYRAAQSKLKRDSKHIEKRGRIHPLTGALYCGHCGARMVTWIGGGFKCGGNRPYWYKCSAAQRDGATDDNASCRMSAVRESQILGAIIPLIATVELRRNAGAGVEVAAKIEELEARIQGLETKASHITAQYAADTITPEQYTAASEMIGQQIRAAKGEKAKLEAVEVDPAYDLLTDNPFLIDASIQRDGIRATIERVELHPYSVVVRLRNGGSYRIQRVPVRSARTVPEPAITLQDSRLSITYRYEDEGEEKTIYEDDTLTIQTRGKVKSSPSRIKWLSQHPE